MSIYNNVKLTKVARFEKLELELFWYFCLIGDLTLSLGSNSGSRYLVGTLVVLNAA